MKVNVILNGRRMRLPRLISYKAIVILANYPASTHLTVTMTRTRKRQPLYWVTDAR